MRQGKVPGLEMCLALARGTKGRQPLNVRVRRPPTGDHIGKGHTSPALSRNMGSYGREKFPHLLEKSPHVREKFTAHTLILSKCSKFWVFFGKIGDLLGAHTLCLVREKRGTEEIPIWRRGREKLAGTGEPNLTFLVSRVFNMAAPMNWREKLAGTGEHNLTFLDGCAQLAGTGEHNLNCEKGGNITSLS
ncbi:hypothetical protein J6590_083914 [Homalodisca vitripennis]|nr:hypothetical protein J6590_083914 [Homalodisca vitripennis]